MKDKGLFAFWKQDLQASIVVFLVALPLCLGIALASGADPISGIIAGVVGGIVVGYASGSALGVSGPAAGLTVIVLTAIGSLGTYELFLSAVVIAGVLQVLLGSLKAGVLAYYFPSSVIKGMLAGIGIIIILKQIPHALGYNKDYEGDLDFVQPDSQNTFSELFNVLNYVEYGSIIIAFIALALLIFWEQPFIKRSKLNVLPGPLLAVLSGVALGFLFKGTSLELGSAFFVALPEIQLGSLTEVLRFPDLSGFGSFDVWKVGLTIAVVASLETLLCVEAADKMDKYKRVTPTNRELVAQGLGNFVSGIIGGLPVTQVIVRSSANAQSGGRTKLSTILHGFLILLCVLMIPGVLRAIPFASLAAVLFVVGYKLAKPILFKEMWQAGVYQFIPFMVTIVGVVFTDLLTGVMIGMAVGIFFILYNNFKLPYRLDMTTMEPGVPTRFELSEDVSFLNKAAILQTLNNLPNGAHVIIDASRTIGLDPDVIEIIRDQTIRAKENDTIIELVGLAQQQHNKRNMIKSKKEREAIEQQIS
ncbi:MAG: SulP family inorganic anion transporter [Flavobacteriales bacterium]|nr:SulP family inorganic anion transporter [Flavobacteriales bacterium]